MEGEVIRKQTRCIQRVLVAPRFIVLEVFPDLLVTKVGADFYIRQVRWIVAEIIEDSPTVRTIVLRTPADQEAKP